MKKWLPIFGGSVAGLVFGCWSLLYNPKPAFCVFLLGPLTALLSDLGNQPGHVPNESLAGLIVIIPAWFLYWAFLGALAGFVPRLITWLLEAFRPRANARGAGVRTLEEGLLCIGVIFIILMFILACFFYARHPPNPSTQPIGP